MVVLICISLIMSNVERLSWPPVCLLWRGAYSDLPSTFLFVFFFFSFYIELYQLLYINPLLVTSFANIFSHLVGHPFILRMVSFVIYTAIHIHVKIKSVSGSVVSVTP